MFVNPHFAGVALVLQYPVNVPRTVYQSKFQNQWWDNEIFSGWPHAKSTRAESLGFSDECSAPSRSCTITDALQPPHAAALDQEEVDMPVAVHRKMVVAPSVWIDIMSLQ